MGKLMISEQQIAFGEAFLISNDAKAAAIAAGYSEKSATTMAYKLMRNPKIVAYIAARRSGKSVEDMRPDRSLMATPRAGKEPQFDDITGADSLEFLNNLMNNPNLPIAQRIKIAIAKLPYEHKKGGGAGAGTDGKPLGKKAARQAGAADPANPFTAVASRPLRAVK